MYFSFRRSTDQSLCLQQARALIWAGFALPPKRIKNNENNQELNSLLDELTRLKAEEGENISEHAAGFVSHEPSINIAINHVLKHNCSLLICHLAVH